MPYPITEDLLTKVAAVVLDAARELESVTIQDAAERAGVSFSAARNVFIAMYDYGALHCVQGYMRGIEPGTMSARFTISRVWAMTVGDAELVDCVNLIVDSEYPIADTMLELGCNEYFPDWVTKGDRGSNGKFPRD